MSNTNHQTFSFDNGQIEETLVFTRSKTMPRVITVAYVNVCVGLFEDGSRPPQWAILNRIIEAISDWMESTEEGRDAFEEDPLGDFNVTDLVAYDYHKEGPLCERLKARGVVIQFANVGDIFDSFDFDTQLVSEETAERIESQRIAEAERRIRTWTTW
ncbi:hypothetical protein [Thioalkalivibrio sp. ALE19]|uniref:hypothetical protein n=1 Tax=Thioalkalivibrio sp. ALE19 TaxID=1266909 RepID=UPI0004201E3A|nr:hypothetical protein [Thioalkalivibrio sp. ALE19]